MQRYLPFWAANALQRLLLVLVALLAIAIAIAVAKIIPRLLSVRHSNRLYRRYRDWLPIEPTLRSRPLSAAVHSAQPSTQRCRYRGRAGAARPD